MAKGITDKLVVLIDADNVRKFLLDQIMNEINKYGNPVVKRIYGDWSNQCLKGWITLLPNHSIQAVQQFAHTKKKNSTDIKIVIDAMQLLSSGKFDAFCIVSSDCDFTGLAVAIREAGQLVYGFGERKTPKPFIAACDKFVFVEDLEP